MRFSKQDIIFEFGDTADWLLIPCELGDGSEDQGFVIFDKQAPSYLEENFQAGCISVMAQKDPESNDWFMWISHEYLNEKDEDMGHLVKQKMSSPKDILFLKWCAQVAFDWLRSSTDFVDDICLVKRTDLLELHQEACREIYSHT